MTATGFWGRKEFSVNNSTENGNANSTSSGFDNLGIELEEKEKATEAEEIQNHKDGESAQFGTREREYLLNAQKYLLSVLLQY